MWDKGLKDEALEIAKTHRSPLRVIAGPGTGKTFALIRRVARIVEEGQDPRRILLVTFTRVSATDLERELDKLGLPQGHNVVKGTLHSLAFSFLHRQNVLDFTHRVARPLLKFEERFLLEDLVLYGDFGIIHQRRAILKAFEAAWAREQNQQPGSPENQSDQNFQVQLEEWLRFHEGMLIGEIIPQTLRYLRANPESEELRQFDHVLVDEYQDLNRAEQSLIDLLAQRGSIAVVGDQDQAIYESFRYAHPEGISEFHTTHNNTYDVPLKTSHRCPSSIVSLANALIRNNMRRSKRQLIPTDEKQPVNVSLVQWTDMETESTNMADYITTRVHDGRYDPGQILILCARRQFGYLIRDNLRARGIPAFSYFDEEELDGDPKIIENSEAQQAFAVLTLLSSRHDRVALRAWLGFGSQSLKNKGYKRIRDYCSTTGLSPFEVLDSLAQGSLEIPYTNGIVSRYQELIQKLNKLNSLPLQEAIDLLFPAEKPWAEPFRSMYSEVKEKLNFATVYELFRTRITQPELPSTATHVRIMSLYKSKGLTADHVFVLGCIEGLIPTYPHEKLPPEDDRRHYEEQRRLFYVAITRAQQTLVLSSTITLPLSFVYHMQIPIRGDDSYVGRTISSTFLGELGQSCPTSLTGNEWMKT